MEDWGRVILSPEAASARFHDKVLVLAAGAEPVTVSRADKEERPDTENAVFDCRVSVLISGGAHSRKIYISNTYEESPRGAASSRTTCHFFWVTSQVSPGLLSHANGLTF